MIVNAYGKEYELFNIGFRPGSYHVYGEDPDQKKAFTTTADECNCSGKTIRTACEHVCAVRWMEDEGPQS